MHSLPRFVRAHRRGSRSRPFVALLSLIAVALLAGCSRQPGDALPTSPSLGASTATVSAGTATAPAHVDGPAGDQGLFVDLAIGNHAEFTRVVRMRVTMAGDPAPGEWFTVNSQVQRTIAGTEVRGSETYTDEVETFVDDAGNRGATEYPWREDRSGLYLWQADVAASAGESFRAVADPLAASALAGFDRQLKARGVDPARRATVLLGAGMLIARAEQARAGSVAGQPIRQAGAQRGGIAAHEITYLRYPLRPGASWEGRIGYNVWTVEAREPLALPAGRFPAVRLRVEVPGAFGPRDRYATWYAAPGEVAHQAHLETVETDDQGQVTGKLELEDVLQLSRWEPARR